MKKLLVSPRQKQIIVLIAKGYNRKAIADKLNLNQNTIDYHMTGQPKSKTSRSILKTLGSVNVAWLTHFAIFTGWVQIGDCKK